MTTPNEIGSLPLELTSFVGREEELAEAKARLVNSRLVTLTGVGGVGKTRLAVRLADGMRTEFEDGVWLVELDRVTEPALLPHAVADTLGLREQSARPLVDVLVEYLAQRRLLLVLDNCEHLLDACERLAVRLLESCPDVRILATSREPLGIRGEAVVSVAPLAIPDGDARLYGEVSGFDAVTLFTERAMAVMPEFRLRDVNQAAVADICHRLDGLPLAIELAAARLRTLPIDEIARRLNDRYQLLSTRMRGIPSRHQTLWASLEWSYDLCSADERRLWARLSVFRGGFELDAAEAVCAGDDLPADAILDLVAALVDKSIVLREGGSLARYRLLETIRDFGWAKLREAREALALRRRHRDWYDQFLKQVDADWIGPRQVDWLSRIDRDLPNLRAALEFCLSEPGEADVGLRMTAVLAHVYWFGRGRLSEGQHWLVRALAKSDVRNPDRLRALHMATLLAVFQGDLAAESGVVEESRALADQLGDASARAQSTLGMGTLALEAGDFQQATVYFQDCLDRFREEGNLPCQLEALIGLGQSVGIDDEPRGNAHLEEVIAIAEPRGELLYRSYALWSLGIAFWRQGNPQRASRLLSQGLVLKREIDDTVGAAYCLEGLAWAAASEQDHRRAAILLGAAQAIADSTGAPTATPLHFVSYHEDCERQARSALREDAFESAFEVGMGMSPHDAVTYATTLKEEIVAQPVQGDPPRARPEQTAAAHAAGESQRPEIRVLIVARNRMEADGIQLVIDQHADLQVLGIATNAGEAIALAAETHPDVILADYQLPDVSGAELAARLRKAEPSSRVLLLSTVVSDALLQEAVKGGARGFLLKTQPAEELADAVRRAAAGEMLISASRLAALISGSDETAHLLDLLTGREREVLRLLATGLDNRHIAARMGIGYVTVRSHLRNISSKLDAHSKVEILARSAQLGLIVR
jgi:non-specific serine/threonine protein kinase